MLIKDFVIIDTLPQNLDSIFTIPYGEQNLLFVPLLSGYNDFNSSLMPPKNTYIDTQIRENYLSLFILTEILFAL